MASIFLNQENTLCPRCFLNSYWCLWGLPNSSPIRKLWRLDVFRSLNWGIIRFHLFPRNLNCFLHKVSSFELGMFYTENISATFIIVLVSFFFISVGDFLSFSQFMQHAPVVFLTDSAFDGKFPKWSAGYDYNIWVADFINYV